MPRAAELAEEAFRALRRGSPEGTRLAAEALELAFAEGDPAAAERAFAARGFGLVLAGRFEEAIALVQEASERVRARFGERPRPAAFSNVAGTAFRRLGLYDRAAEYLLEAERLAAAAGDRVARSSALVNLGNVLSEMGEQALAAERFTEAIGLFEAIGEQDRANLARSNLGFVLGESGRDEEAIPVLQDAIARAAASGDRATRGRALDSLGGSQARLGLLDEAIESFRESAGFLDGGLLSYERGESLVHLAEVLHRRGRDEEALAQLGRLSAPEGGETAPQIRSGECLARARALETLGREKEAVAAYREYVELDAAGARGRGLVALRDRELEERRAAALDLELALMRRTERLARAQESTIGALAALAEARDWDTGLHLERTARFVAILAEEHARGGEAGFDSQRAALYASTSVLHDIGKVGIPDSVLRKPGQLDHEETVAMRRHVEVGERVLESIRWDDPDSPYAASAREIVGAHHENWDGSGYPRGLSGRGIPSGGRIMAVADVYDAIRSVRPYKGPRVHEEALEQIAAGSGGKFDPAIVASFLRVAGTFASAYAELS